MNLKRIIVLILAICFLLYGAIAISLKYYENHRNPAVEYIEKHGMNKFNPEEQDFVEILYSCDSLIELLNEKKYDEAFKFFIDKDYEAFIKEFSFEELKECEVLTVEESKDNTRFIKLAIYDMPLTEDDQSTDRIAEKGIAYKYFKLVETKDWDYKYKFIDIVNIKED